MTKTDKKSRSEVLLLQVTVDGSTKTVIVWSDLFTLDQLTRVSEYHNCRFLVGHGVYLLSVLN
jgi:hypothetical protein